jgi:hypothetical protein
MPKTPRKIANQQTGREEDHHISKPETPQNLLYNERETDSPRTVRE